MLNPRLPPGRHPLGLGDSLSEFNTLYSADPAVRSAWGPLAQQLQHEGADQTAVDIAKSQFAGALDQLGQQIGVDPTQALAAAQQYVAAGHTIAGMAGNIVALVNSSGHTPPSAAIQALAGTLVGAATLAGSLSFGVGAAIVAGVALVGAALDALFGGATPGVEVCPGIHCNPAPQWTLVCACAYGAPANPSTNAWKNFPDPTRGEDLVWYSNCNGAQNWPPSQTSSGQITVWGNCTFSQAPLIFQAFAPMWHLYCEQSQLMTGPVSDFQRGFFSAWKANAAFALNGLKAATDTEVLIHYARVWNRTHERGAGYDIQPSSATIQSYPRPPIGQTWPIDLSGRVLSTPSCVLGADSYESILVGGGDPTLKAGQTNFQGSLASNDPLLSGQALHINTGPLKNVGGLVSGFLSAKPPVATAVSKAAPAVAAATAATVLGTVAYSYLTGKAIDTVVKAGWGRIAGLFK